VGAVRERLSLRREAFAAPDVLARRLRRCGVTGESALAAAEMLRTLDRAAFGTAVGASDSSLARGAWEAYAQLDAEGCGPRLDGRTASTVGARAGLAVLLSASPALSAVPVADARQQSPTDVTVLQRQPGEAPDAAPGGVAVPAGEAVAARAFDRGVRAYDRQQLGEARTAFAEAAAAAPRAPDAWANLGTVAWTAGDTVQAAIGWQRALRLDPLASDVRDHLAMLPAAQDGWTAGVPPIPANGAAAAGLLVWALAGAAVTLRVRRRAGASLTPIVWSGGAAAVLLLALSVRLGDVAEGRDLFVVRDDGAARTEPALAAEQAAPVQVSDVARVLARQNAWARVRLDGGREGWIEGDRLAPLALP
jgi:tetratricopeptide (TPR) repeat protein